MVIGTNCVISIHALLAESDVKVVEIGVRCIVFLSTLSLRRATRRWGTQIKPYYYFYPRSPCGERLRRSASIWLDRWISIHALLAESDLMWPWSPLNNDLFLSTLSLRRATCGTSKNAANYQISIHALLAESDARP